MVAKTIMKRIAIAVLSAVILNGVIPLDSLNVYASENTGASYTALDLYTYLQDQCTTEYTLTEKAETFLEEHVNSSFKISSHFSPSSSTS